MLRVETQVQSPALSQMLRDTAESPTRLEIRRPGRELFRWREALFPLLHD